jgi:acyl carrier protein
MSEPAVPAADSAPTATAADAADVLAELQRGYDLVKPARPHALTRGDDITEDLDLDSLDLVDLISVLEERLGYEVIDAVVDRVPDMATVGDVVDCVVELTR